MTSAGWSPATLAATYDPTEEGGLQKLKSADSVLAFVPYAFYVQYGAELHLKMCIRDRITTRRNP